MASECIAGPRYWMRCYADDIFIVQVHNAESAFSKHLPAAGSSNGVDERPK